MFSSPISSAISTFAPSMVPMISDPFMANFMLPVPEASVPAVLMCWLSSEPALPHHHLFHLRDGRNMMQTDKDTLQHASPAASQLCAWCAHVIA
jgi:hypothetical protein